MSLRDQIKALENKIAASRDSGGSGAGEDEAYDEVTRLDLAHQYVSRSLQPLKKARAELKVRGSNRAKQEVEKLINQWAKTEKALLKMWQKAHKDFKRNYGEDLDLESDVEL